MSDATICLIILATTIAFFVWNRLPVEIVALGSALALYATGLLSADQVFAGFGDPVIAFIAGLFVMSEALGTSGVTAWAGQWLAARAGASQRRLLVLMMLLAACLAALISVNGATAALLPMVVLLAVRLGHPVSRLAMPLAFAGHAGSLLVLTATPINVLVSSAAADATGEGFGFFAFGLAGVPLVAGVLAITVLAGDRLLPHRTPRSLPADLSGHSRTLADTYRLAREPGLGREFGVAEVVVGPRSGLVGDRVYPGMTTDSGELVVLAVARAGSALGPEPVTLVPGDIVLVRGAWRDLERHTTGAGLLVVDPPEEVRRQAVPLGPGSTSAIVILVAMIVLLATGAVPPAIAAVGAAGAMIVTRVLTMRQAYAGISWTTIVIVAGMFPLSVAMRESGAADVIADAVVGVFGGSGITLLIGLFLVTAVLGQVISNTATALILIPIAVSAAAEVGVSARPLLMTVGVAAAAAVLTPVATAANLMVQEPGGYRFGDYWKLGLPVLGWFLIVAVTVIPLAWPF